MHSTLYHILAITQVETFNQVHVLSGGHINATVTAVDWCVSSLCPAGATLICSGQDHDPCTCAGTLLDVGKMFRAIFH